MREQQEGRRDGREKEKSSDIQRAKRRALHILEQCDRTERELREKLEKNYEPEAVEEAVAYVKSFHYLDDMRYAVHYLSCRGQEKSRRQVEQELLYKKGISREILEKASLEVEPQDEREQIRRWMEKKRIHPETADQAELRRFYSFLLRRGFRSEDILREIRAE